jgi:hypothetical protein
MGTRNLLFLIIALGILASFIDAQEQERPLRRRPLRPGSGPKRVPTEQAQPAAPARAPARVTAAPAKISAPAAAISDDCPEPNGFFPDAYQCDKYYECRDGKIKEKLCADGLVFIDAGPNVEKCEFAFAVDCADRPELQPPQPSMNCPRKNGYFAHEDTAVCDKFFFCVDGMFNAITCPAGLVFSNKTGTCTWPDQAKKQYCSSGELFDFNCPAMVGEREAGEMVHPRFPDPKDCQSFYVCIDGKVPRKKWMSTWICLFRKNWNVRQTEKCT